jgi:hypothetical protein
MPRYDRGDGERSGEGALRLKELTASASGWAKIDRAKVATSQGVTGEWGWPSGH